MKKIIIATRSSELALRQARQVQAALAEQAIESELKTYKTTGDKRLGEALSEIGAKGLFTAELEHDLANGDVDCCVHSLKDLPTEGPAGLEIVAQLRREDPRDVLIVNGEILRANPNANSIETLPAGLRVGTSSLRRRAQLLALRNDLEVVELRGNVPTRIKKVDERQVDAAILAAAGLHRLDMAQRITAYLSASSWLPAAGQGAIAIQIRSNDVDMRAIFSTLGDVDTMIATRAERAFLGALEGGCQVPIGAIAIATGNVRTLHGFIADVDGKRSMRGQVVVDANDPASSGVALAAELRDRGATEMLAGLHRARRVPSPQPE